MKLYYLSSSAFSDNQIALLKHLSSTYEITYAVIIPSTNSNFSETELSTFCSENGIRFVPILLQYRFRDPRSLHTYYAILRAIRQEDPDIVYLCNFDQLYFNTLCLLLNRYKTIVSFHDVESHSNTPFSFLVNLSKQLLISQFSYFQTYSQIQQTALRAMARGKSVYNISLPLLDFGPLPVAQQSEQVINFLFFGFILPYKGLDLLLDAFSAVACRYPNARLTIAGRCQDWEKTYAPLVNNSPQIVTHIRFIENVEIPSFFSNTDYLVLPYRDTTQSGPLMIAYNYNVPVLFSDAEGFREFTAEGVTGYGFNPTNRKDFEQVLESCLMRSRPEYIALKERLDTYTKTHFSIQAITNKYYTMFDEIAGHSSSFILADHARSDNSSLA